MICKITGKVSTTIKGEPAHDFISQGLNTGFKAKVEVYNDVDDIFGKEASIISMNGQTYAVTETKFWGKPALAYAKCALGEFTKHTAYFWYAYVESTYLYKHFKAIFDKEEKIAGAEIYNGEKQYLGKMSIVKDPYTKHFFYIDEYGAIILLNEKKVEDFEATEA